MTSPMANKTSRPPEPARRKTVSGTSSANSTVNIFLGAARNRKLTWLKTTTADKNNPHPPRQRDKPVQSPEPSPPPLSPPRPASPAAACSIARSTPPAPKPTLAADDSTTTRPTGMSHLLSPSQETLASFRGNQNSVASSAPAVTRDALPRLQISATPSTPHPSITPSPALQNNELPPRPVNAQAQQQTQQRLPPRKPQQLQAHLKQQPASLPSPDPSIPSRAHASPTSAVDRNGPPITSPSAAAFPSPPLQQAPSNQLPARPNGPAVGASPASVPGNQQGNTSLVHYGSPRIIQYAGSGHSHPAPAPAPAPISASPSMQHQPPISAIQALAANRPSIITAEFFERAKRNLLAFIRSEGPLLLSSDRVDLPRLHLLDHALDHRDLIYLALHQVYCFSSHDPARLLQLPEFTQEHMQALHIIQDLLVDNQNLAPHIVRWCVDFPHSIHELLKDWRYLTQYHQMLRLLADLVAEWPRFAAHVHKTGHPPLMDDMKSLGVMSVTLQLNIFLCLSRRISSSGSELPLRAIHMQDQDYFWRSLKEPVSAEQRRRENMEIVTKYHEVIAAMQRDSAGQPRVTAPHSMPFPGQAVPTPVSAPAGQLNMQYRSPYAQLHPEAQNRNGISPATLRSPLAAAPPMLPSQPIPQQAVAQQRGVEPQMLSPVTTTTPQFMAPRELPRGQPSQQFPHQPRSQYPHTQQPLPQHPRHTGPQSPTLAPNPLQHPQQAQPQPQPQPQLQNPDSQHLQNAGPHSPALTQPPFPQLQHPQSSQNSSYTAPQSPGLVQPLPQHPQRFQHSQRPQQFQHSPSHQLLQQRGLQSLTLVQQPLQRPQTLASHSIPLPNIQYAAQQQTQLQHPRQPQQQPQRRYFCAPLLPPPNVPPVMNTRPNPNRLAIHQAHLRDPVNRFISMDATGMSDTELLPHMTSFLMKPKILRREDGPVKETVSLSNNEIRTCAFYQEQERGGRVLRTFKEGTQTYRIRCIKVPKSTKDLDVHSWCVAETAWPTAIYVHVNNMELFPRRKIHNTRDLPLDITPALLEGANKIEVSFIPSPAEQKSFTFAVAAEVLTFRSLAPAKSLAQTLPAADSQKRIHARLARNPQNDDDELRIVSDDLKVTLVDPYTARIFDVPVRGRHCEHTECFDHETFLQTRLLKSGNQSAIEADWKCPICSRDARPQNLIIDEFLADVRSQLERTNRCDGARFLEIKADGTWDVKTDDDISSSEQTLKRKSSAQENGLRRLKVDRSASVPDRTPNRFPAVIVLD